MIEPALNQTQVQPQLDFGFAEGLRALMRQDPDIIMVGEIRDLATAEMAIQAALTGHLVFSTLHTNDAVGAIARLADLGVPSYLIAATVIGVLAQRWPARCARPARCATNRPRARPSAKWPSPGACRAACDPTNPWAAWNAATPATAAAPACTNCC
jgi:general secretion pathway protein E